MFKMLIKQETLWIFIEFMTFYSDGLWHASIFWVVVESSWVHLLKYCTYVEFWGTSENQFSAALYFYRTTVEAIVFTPPHFSDNFSYFQIQSNYTNYNK